MGRTAKPTRPALIIALALSSCAPTKPASLRSPELEPAKHVSDPSAAPAGWFIEAQAEGPDEPRAYAEAERQLATALLGDARYAALAGITVHRRGLDPERIIAAESGKVSVSLGLDASQSAGVLAALGEATPRFEAPAPWRDTWHELFFTHLQRIACERRKALFDVDCPPVAAVEIDARAAEVLEGIRLVSAYEGGYPVDAAGQPLRAPLVHVLWHGVLLGDVPLVVTDQASDAPPTRMISDAHGELQLPVPASGADGWTVAVDLSTLLGPLAEAMRGRIHIASLELGPRPASRRRWAMIDVRGTPLPALHAIEERLGLPAPASVPAHLAATVRTEDRTARREAVKAVGDAMGGRVDVLLLAQSREQYAGRGGSGRVWWEATVDLEIYEAWRGTQLEAFTVSKTTLGITDVKAQAAAREEAMAAALEHFAVWASSTEQTALRLPVGTAMPAGR